MKENKLSPRQDSNLHLKISSLELYPLNFEGTFTKKARNKF